MTQGVGRRQDLFHPWQLYLGKLISHIQKWNKYKNKFFQQQKIDEKFSPASYRLVGIHYPDITAILLDIAYHSIIHLSSCQILVQSI